MRNVEMVRAKSNSVKKFNSLDYDFLNEYILCTVAFPQFRYNFIIYKGCNSTYQYRRQRRSGYVVEIWRQKTQGKQNDGARIKSL